MKWSRRSVSSIWSEQKGKRERFGSSKRWIFVFPTALAALRLSDEL